MRVIEVLFDEIDDMDIMEKILKDEQGGCGQIVNLIFRNAFS